MEYNWFCYNRRRYYVGEREFLIYLDTAHKNRYRHWHVWERGKIIEFRIQYEALIADNWHPVV